MAYLNQMISPRGPGHSPESQTDSARLVRPSNHGRGGRRGAEAAVVSSEKCGDRQNDVPPTVFVVGISYKSAALHALESLYLDDGARRGLLSKLNESLDECVVISTCNRTEIYGVTRRQRPDLELYKRSLLDFKGATRTAMSCLYSMTGIEACRHLYSVAAGIDSKVIGDAQILGQVRKAYESARQQGTTGKITNQLFQRAFKVGKRTRTETGLYRGAVSVSLAAAELAAKFGATLSCKTALVIGAGEAAAVTADCLIKKGVGKLIMANRTRSRAEKILSALRRSYNFVGESFGLEHLDRCLSRADVVISAARTAKPLVTKCDLEHTSGNILLIDIGMPRNIDPDVAELESVSLFNLDDLHGLADNNYRRRLGALPRVNQIIDAELADFLDWYRLLPHLPAKLKRGQKPDDSTRREIVGLKAKLKANEFVRPYRSGLIAY